MIISNKTKFTVEEKVLIECDFKVSPKCKKQYFKLYKNIIKTRESNDGKDRCVFCFNSMTKTGENNYNFKFKKEENFFENIDCEIKAYLLGWVAGDGHIKKDGLHLEIHKIDYDILDLFRIHISTENAVHRSKRKDETKTANTLCWHVNSVKIVKDLLKQLKLNNYGKKSDKIRLPDISEDLQWIFIRGLFDSDGHVSPIFGSRKTPQATLCSISQEILKEIMLLCDKNKIKYYFNTTRPVITFNGLNCIKFLNKIYDNSNFHLSRKHAMWTIWKTWAPFIGSPFWPRKLRTYYPPISEEHKNKIKESNKKRKGRKYGRK